MIGCSTTGASGHGTSRNRGIKALFAGESGTGKTMSAEVLAGELGLDLYVIDLSTVVDKYIGETEKNLDRIFAEAERVNGVLLFDEADALFGKRSDVQDAHDRYANVETAYLLQRMDTFEGLAVLTTNLRSNIDEAFARRLDVIVDFPMPEDADRRRLWELHLGPSVPRADDIDLDFLARSFRIAGGNIRNVALGAAYLAADDDRAVSMVDLVRATEREYRKLGRLCVESEFGPYFPLVAGAGAPVTPAVTDALTRSPPETKSLRPTQPAGPAATGRAASGRRRRATGRPRPSSTAPHRSGPPTWPRSSGRPAAGPSTSASPSSGTPPPWPRPRPSTSTWSRPSTSCGGPSTRPTPR